MTPYVCSIKKSLKHAMWKLKDPVSHEHVWMVGMQYHLDEAVSVLGGDVEDLNTLWDFIYHTVELPRFTFHLSRTTKDPGGTVEYQVVESRAGSEVRPLWLPAQLLSVYPIAPQELWIRIEKSWADRPIFLSPYGGN